MNQLKEFINNSYSGLSKSKVIEITAQVIDEQIVKLKDEIAQNEFNPEQESSILNLSKDKLYSEIKIGMLEMQKNMPDVSKIEFAKIHIPLLLEIIENENLNKLEFSHASVKEEIINSVFIPNYLIEWTFNNFLSSDINSTNLTLREFVEINGVKWGTANLGAMEPIEFGNYYTFGNAVDAIDDGWRLPTEDEFESLISSKSIWKNINGVNGRLFGIEPNQLFLPAAGFHRYESEFREFGKNGKYWCKSVTGIGIADTATVKILDFNNSSISISSAGTYHGRTIRCVKI